MTRITNLVSRRLRRDPDSLTTVDLERHLQSQIFAAQSNKILEETRRIIQDMTNNPLPRADTPDSGVDRGAAYVQFVRQRNDSFKRQVERENAMIELEEILQQDSRLKALHEEYGQALQEAMRQILEQRMTDSSIARPRGQSQGREDKEELSDES